MVKRSVHFSISEQLFRQNVKRFRGGFVFKAHRLVYHSTLGWRVIKKKKKTTLVKRHATQRTPRLTSVVKKGELHVTVFKRQIGQTSRHTADVKGIFLITQNWTIQREIDRDKKRERGREREIYIARERREGMQETWSRPCTLNRSRANL